MAELKLTVAQLKEKLEAGEVAVGDQIEVIEEAAGESGSAN
jgi:hypothetical protein